VRFLTIIFLALLVACEGGDAASEHLASWRDRLEDHYVSTIRIRWGDGDSFTTYWEFREDQWHTPGWKRLWNNAQTDHVGPPRGVAVIRGLPSLSHATATQVRLSIRGTKITRNNVVIDDHLQTALLEIDEEDWFWLNGNKAFIESVDSDNP